MKNGFHMTKGEDMMSIRDREINKLLGDMQESLIEIMSEFAEAHKYTVSDCSPLDMEFRVAQADETEIKIDFKLTVKRKIDKDGNYV